MDHVSEQERQEPLCLSVLGIPFRHSRNRAILGRFDVRGIIILPTRFKGVQRHYTACRNVLNVNIKELKKAALNLKTFSTCFNLFELQEPVIVSLLEVSEAVRPTRKNQNRKSRCTVFGAVSK